MTGIATMPETTPTPTPRPVVCVIDELHRDVSVADAACQGVFTHGGVTLQLGRHPDWRAGGLVDDEEWRIEWVKGYEGLDLAYAFAVTGHREYLTTWEDLVASYCDQVPVGHDTSDVTARRLQNWLYAWQRFASSKGYRGLRAGLGGRLLQRLHADAGHLGRHLTAERNHRTLELYALLLVSIAADVDRTRAEAVLDLLAANAATDVWDDGVHRECSTDYHLIVLRSFLGAIANAHQARLNVPPELTRRVGLMCDFALHVQRPDGLTPAISDGDQGDFRSVLRLAAKLLDRPELAWAATGGAQGTPPAKRLVSFPTGGYHLQRSGWGENGRSYTHERWCLIDCGPLGDGGHGHYDQLSLELAADGHSLVVDPGRYTYAEDAAGWRRWFKGTAAHNTVTVDGLDQTPYRRGKPKGPVSTARLLGRWTRPGLDVVRGEVRSPSYEAVHTRTVAFVADDYWVVHDRLRGTNVHSYCARWHLAPQRLVPCTTTTRAHQTAVLATGMVLVVPSGFGDVTQEQGWVSPTYGVKHAAPVVAVTSAGHTGADLLTVIVPGGPDVTVTALCNDDLVEVAVARPGVGTDRLWWSFDSTEPRWDHRPC